jgi:hypothetical protein
VDNEPATTAPAGMMRRVLTPRLRSLGAPWLFAAAAVTGAVTGCDAADGERGGPRSLPAAAPPIHTRVEAPAPRARALRVLRDWDAARAAALARGDRSALARLYTPRSGLAGADVALLERYGRRGLELTAVQHQAVRVELTASGRGLVELMVVERLAVVEVRDGAGRERRLPGSQFASLALRFERAGGGWRLSSAREV